MTKAAQGIMHTFVGSSVLTNTEHTTDSRMLLRRMVSHVYTQTVTAEFRTSAAQPSPKSAHVPKFNTVEGVEDLFNLLNVTELSDILNPLSYAKLGLHVKERVRMMHARKLSRIILRWFWCNYEIVQVHDGARSVVEDGQRFYYEGLGRQMKALLQYKKDAEKKGMTSDVKDCTATAVDYLIRKVFEGNATFFEAYNKTPRASLAWQDIPFEVNIKEPPSVFNLEDCSK